MDFKNSWGNSIRSASYSRLEFPNTYYLAYRDLPQIFEKHITGRKALDFGCGTGRSTRFLKRLGFSVTGIDIAADMLNYAKDLDPSGDYFLVSDGDYSCLSAGTFNLILSVFTFDNIAGWDKRKVILESLSELLAPDGKLILLDSNSLIYHNEWASFSTADFPQNKLAQTGDIVRIIMKDVEDKSPVEDIFWTEADYLRLFEMSGLRLSDIIKPLGLETEPFEWINETRIAPWIIFVLQSDKQNVSVLA